MNLFQELKRRKVFKTVGVYAAAALIIIQVADIVFPRLLLPDWTVKQLFYISLLFFTFRRTICYKFIEFARLNPTIFHLPE